MLKAVVWRLSGNVHRGTLAAGWGGRIAAVLALSYPVVLREVSDEEPQLIDFVIAIVIALFLWTGATAAMASARLRRRLPSLVARNLARRTLTVPEDLPLSEAVRRAQEAEAGSIVTVSGAGRPVGIVSEAALLATPEDRRPWVAVSTVARSAEGGLTLPAAIGGEELILAISRHPGAGVPPGRGGRPDLRRAHHRRRGPGVPRGQSLTRLRFGHQPQSSGSWACGLVTNRNDPDLKPAVGDQTAVARPAGPAHDRPH